MNFGMEEIMALLTEFIKKYPSIVENGSAYILQDRKAQIDAIQLVCDIVDNMFYYSCGNVKIEESESNNVKDI